MVIAQHTPHAPIRHGVCYTLRMHCPHCKNIALTPRSLDTVRIDTCTTCNGTWFDVDELRTATKERLPHLNWFDVHLWRHDADFFGSPSVYACPACTDEHLTCIRYGDSPIEITACPCCHGIWLDKGQYDAILAYIQTQGDTAVLEQYYETVGREIRDAINDGEAISDEWVQIVTLIDLFKYKFLVEHPRMTHVLEQISRIV